MKAWYIDDDPQNPGAELHRNPPQFLSPEVLFEKTGVQCWKLNVETFEADGELDRIRKERGYTYEDHMGCARGNPDCEEKLKAFYTEHLHSEEEIRFLLEGGGYFDVRDGEDSWIRVSVTAGDLVVLPSGIYHRFTLGPHDQMLMKRLFLKHPIWRAYNRPCDEMECRQSYVRNQRVGFQATA